MHDNAQPGENRVEAMTWPQVAARIRQGAAAVLPVGAAAKEHGPHLPLATDAIQAVYFAEQLASRHDLLIWPVVSYGYYPAFTDYPGSTSIGEPTFRAMVGQLISNIEQAGVARLIILNTGISTIAPLRRVLEHHHGASRVGLLNSYSGAQFCRLEAELTEQSFGGHADEVETSLMLAIAPDQVDMSAAVAAENHIRRGRFNRRDSAASNYSPSGVNGDATKATAAKGEQLLEALLSDLEQEIAEFLDTASHG